METLPRASPFRVVFQVRVLFQVGRQGNGLPVYLRHGLHRPGMSPPVGRGTRREIEGTL